MKQRIVLGIESSCDETGAAIVVDGRRLLCDEVWTSLAFHEQYGGVVPEIAARQHLLAIIPVIKGALAQANLRWQDLSAIGVTSGPGLIGSLLVGLAAAKTLASVFDLPLVPVHHLAGHIAANYLAFPDLEPPFMALIVSGAHSHIVAVRDYCDFEILARTRDDAPGEVYDKLGREMGLAYPGGPKLDALAQSGQALYKLPSVHFKDSLDFSFSGLKTAALNLLNKERQKAEHDGVAWESRLAPADLAASFQEAVASTLARHVDEALTEVPLPRLVLAGGVAANSAVRGHLAALAKRRGLPFYCPPLRYCTDQAAMIAAQAYYNLQAGLVADSSLNARALMELGGA